MSNCSSNKLDPELFEDPRIEEGQQCDPGDPYPTCSDTINICLCSPEIDDPPDPNVATCVNDIIKRPWPPPPPANPGCNPLSVFVSSRQDTSVPATQNIRLEGGVSYVGNDPCLPELNLELLVNPDFRAGGGAPSARGWGISEYGHIPSLADPWDGIRICPDACCDFNDPQQYLAEAPGGESFIPDNGLICSSTLNDCNYRYTWAKKVARWGLIGPILCNIVQAIPDRQYDIAWMDDDGNVKEENNVTTSWKYTLEIAMAVTSGDESILGGTGSCAGIPYIPGLANNISNVILNSIKEEFEAYNIKENTGEYEPASQPFFSIKMNPGIDLAANVKAGFFPQPVMVGTPVLVYGKVPWSNIPENDPAAIAAACNCEIVWFFDVPNALAGACRVDTATPPLSMLPSRKISSAGQFFGIPSNENRV